MQDRPMHFLDTRSRSFSNVDVNISIRTHPPTISASHRDRYEVMCFGHRKRVFDVPRAAARRDAEGDVAMRPKRLELSAEHELVTVVIRNCRHDTRVGGQGYPRKPSPFVFEPANELSNKVFGVRGASAIAEG